MPASNEKSTISLARRCARSRCQPGLRAALHQRLAEERGNSKRRRFRKYAAMAAAAAAILLVGLGIHLWQATHLPAVDIDGAWAQRNLASADRDDVEAFLRKHAPDAVLPLGFNYGLLTEYRLGKFQGKQVPQLTFLGPEKDGRVEYACMYLLTNKQFDLKPLAEAAQDLAAEKGYKFKLVVRYPEDTPRQAIVIFHTADNLHWLQPQEPPAGPGV